jgi:hypothetical protein
VKILLDQGVPLPVREVLCEHNVETAFEKGWSVLKNGELIARAERGGFEVFISTDQNLKYQQNLKDRKIAIVILKTTSWPKIKNQTELTAESIRGIKGGAYVEITFQESKGKV